MSQQPVRKSSLQLCQVIISDCNLRSIGLILVLIYSLGNSESVTGPASRFPRIPM